MSKIFKKFNKEHNHKCPICGTNEEKETVLIPISGTEKDGIAEAVQVHLDCLLNSLFYFKAEEHDDVIACTVNFKYE